MEDNIEKAGKEKTVFLIIQVEEKRMQEEQDANQV